ncbi:MAG TPA: hypothetical protein PKV98_04505 [Burkholderiaceae bacterium]|nr:hypothetical protein [Burkholderiaceae bacterium]
MRWPKWLPFIGFRKELVDSRLAFVLGVRPGLYDVFAIEWFGIGCTFGHYRTR